MNKSQKAHAAQSFIQIRWWYECYNERIHFVQGGYRRILILVLDFLIFFEWDGNKAPFLGLKNDFITTVDTCYYYIFHKFVSSLEMKRKI